MESTDRSPFENVLTAAKETTDTSSERSYIAFISYRHRDLDREAAELVQKKIENYIVPKEFREKTGGKKLGLCFRDEDELPASASLTDSIYYALDHTKYLIVICTPDLPQSKWCEAEIRYFLQTHDRDHLLAVLADGDPSDSFSPLMRYIFDEEGNITGEVEPLAANIATSEHKLNKKASKKEIVRLYAALIGCPFDELWQRERRARTNRILTLAGAAVAVMAVFLGVVLNSNAKIAAQNDLLSQKNNEIQEQNVQITNQNTQIEEQNNQLQSRLSAGYVDSGFGNLAKHKRDAALQDSLSALESNDPNLYDHRAEKLLGDALGIYQDNEFVSDVVYEQTTEIKKMQLSEDQTRIYLLDAVGKITALDARDYHKLWDYRTETSDTEIFTRLPEDAILIKSEGFVCALSEADGTVLWTYTLNWSNQYLHELSEDGTVFAFTDATEEDAYLAEYVNSEVDRIYFLDTSDGSILGNVLLPNDEYSMNHWLISQKPFAGAFTPDDRHFFCFFPVVQKETPEAENSSDMDHSAKTDDTAESEESFDYIFLRTDLSDFKTSEMDRMELGYEPFFFGFDFSKTDDSFFVLFYARGYNGIISRCYQGFDTDAPFTEDKFIHSRKAYDVTEEMLQLTNSVARFLSNETDYFICSGNEFAIVTKDNKLYGYITLTDLILDAFWADENKDVLYIITADGLVTKVAQKEDGGYGRMSVASLIDLNNMRAVIEQNGGPIENPEQGNYLCLDASESGKLLCFSRISDPKISEPDFQALLTEDYLADYNMILPVPDSDLAMLFTRIPLKETEEDAPSVIEFDRKTGEVQNVLPKVDSSFDFTDQFIVLDKDHFLFRNNIYGMDGSIEPYSLEGVDDSDRDFDNQLKNRLLSDGRILTFYAGSDDSRSLCCPVWLDGKLVDGSNNVLPGFDFDFANYYLPYFLGNNGTIIIREYTSENEDAAPVFRVFNALTGSFTKMESPLSHSESWITNTGMCTPVFAVAFAEGPIALFDPVSGKITLLEETYSFNEVDTFGFSDDDRYLIVLTSERRLDIFDTSTLEKVFSQAPGKASNLYYSDNSVPVLEAYDTPEDHTLYVKLDEYYVLIDMESWIIRAEIADVAYVDRENDSVYIYDSPYGQNYRFRKCPLYSLDVLQTMAEEKLAQG